MFVARFTNRSPFNLRLFLLRSKTSVYANIFCLVPTHPVRLWSRQLVTTPKPQFQEKIQDRNVRKELITKTTTPPNDLKNNCGKRNGVSNTKFYPLFRYLENFKVSLQKQLENHGYSTIKIAAGTAVFTGALLYYFRDWLREKLAGEVTDVATRSLSDKELQERAQLQAKALLDEILTDEKLQEKTSLFITEVLRGERARGALVSLLLRALQDSSVQAELVILVKRLASQLLADDVFRDGAGAALRHISQEETTRTALLDLLLSAVDSDAAREHCTRLVVDVLSRDAVQQSATSLGKDAAQQLSRDESVRSEASDALWGVLVRTITPSLFRRSKSQPTGDTSIQESLETTKEAGKVVGDADYKSTEDKSIKDLTDNEVAPSSRLLAEEALLY